MAGCSKLLAEALHGIGGGRLVLKA
jgi:hypothetical protein